MLRRTCCLAVVAGCSFSAPTVTGGDAAIDGAIDAHRPPMRPGHVTSPRKLVFDNAAGAQLDSFPLLVILDPSRIDYSVVPDPTRFLKFTDGSTSACRSRNRAVDARRQVVHLGPRPADRRSLDDRLHHDVVRHRLRCAARRDTVWVTVVPARHPPQRLDAEGFEPELHAGADGHHGCHRHRGECCRVRQRGRSPRVREQRAATE